MKIYLRIGEKLTKRTPEENTETELIARPKGYKQKSVEFLLKAWESDRNKLYLLPVWFNNYLEEWSDRYLLTYESFRLR